MIDYIEEARRQIRRELAPLREAVRMIEEERRAAQKARAKEAQEARAKEAQEARRE